MCRSLSRSKSLEISNVIWIHDNAKSVERLTGSYIDVDYIEAIKYMATPCVYFMCAHEIKHVQSETYIIRLLNVS